MNSTDEETMPVDIRYRTYFVTVIYRSNNVSNENDAYITGIPSHLNGMCAKCQWTFKQMFTFLEPNILHSFLIINGKFI